VVVKAGGRALADPAALAGFAADVALVRRFGVRPVVVHGGAPQIDEQLAREGMGRGARRGGMRETGPETARVAEMVLAGSVNKRVAQAIADAGGEAVGISGRDGGLLRARPAKGALGLVGEEPRVDIRVLLAIEQAGMVPVVAPTAAGPDGEILNLNADTAAGAVAVALGAVRLLMATDVEGLLDARGRLVPELTTAQARAMLRRPEVAGGMRPKLETCVAAVEGGVEAAVILDGRVPRALLLELFTSAGAGTRVRAARRGG